MFVYLAFFSAFCLGMRTLCCCSFKTVALNGTYLVFLFQETALGESLKNAQKRWEQCWAVLQAYNLYLCRQLSSYVSDETQEKVSFLAIIFIVFI